MMNKLDGLLIYDANNNSYLTVRDECYGWFDDHCQIGTIFHTKNILKRNMGILKKYDYYEWVYKIRQDLITFNFWCEPTLFKALNAHLVHKNLWCVPVIYESNRSGGIYTLNHNLAINILY